MPRLGRSGPTGGGSAGVTQFTYNPFFSNIVWSLVSNVGVDTVGVYSGDTFNVSTGIVAGRYTRALGTLNYTSAAPLACAVTVTVTQNSGVSGGFFFFVDGVQTAVVKVVENSVVILPVGVNVISLGTLPAGTHQVLIQGLIDIAQPSRLFSYSGGGGKQCAYSATLHLV